MIMDFPNSPSVGARHTVGNKAWEWDGSTWNSVITKEYIDATLPQSETPPSSPSAGDTWFKTSTGQTYTYYDSYWVEFGRGSTGAGAASETSWGLVSTEDQTFSGNKTFTGSISSYNWQSPNYVVNGNFSVHQRLTDAPGYRPEGYQGPDRWFMSSESYEASYSVFSRPSRLVCFFGTSSGPSKAISASQTIAPEVAVNDLLGKTVTLSVAASAGEGTTNLERFSIRLAIGGFSSEWLPMTSTEEIYHMTATVLDNPNRPLAFYGLDIAVIIEYEPGAGDMGGVYMTNIQLEIGSLPTRFRLSQGSYQNELAECQRYFYAIKGPLYSFFTGPQAYGSGWNANTTTAYHFIPFPQTMVKTPTALIVDGSVDRFGVGNLGGDEVNISTTLPIHSNLTSRSGAVVQTTVGNVLVQGNTSFFCMTPWPEPTGGDQGFLAWSAEY
jgi:hypothetical protein